MRETDTQTTTSRQRLPLGNAFAATIAQLKTIADRSTDAALTEGTVSPDRLLLEAASEALHLLKHGEAMNKERLAMYEPSVPISPEIRAKAHDMFEESQDLLRLAKRLMFKAKKMPAKTAAGIFAKAMLVRCSKTGAAEMAMSLAEDMVSCKELRAVLWAVEAPSGVGD